MREFGPYSARSMTPVTSVGIANGMSTIVESHARPGNSYRTST